jgi:thiol-disulfide isomerase/thioredoxin
MKKTTFLVAFTLTISLFASAQQQPARPAQDPSAVPAPYLRNPTIPPCHMLGPDSSTYVTKEDLKKHRRTMIMFFSPDCDHCKHQTDSILEAADKFKDIEIVMATYQPFNEMKEFNTHYRLFEHPNIKIGRDEKFFLVPFYRIHSLTYLALYDKKGNLITTFGGTQKIGRLLNTFEKKGNQD